MKFIAKVLATCFGVGFFPLAPGTLTSFIVILLYKLYLHRLNWVYYLLFILSVFFVGVIVSSVYSSEAKKRDPRSIVIDEAIGQLLVVFRLSPTWFLLLLGFALFRFFDIVKPFLIKRTEQMPKGWGIMMDDFLAAIYAGILINVYLLLK